MDQAASNRLNAIEAFCHEVLKECHSLRRELRLEGVSTPTSKKNPLSQEKVMKILAQRRKRMSKKVVH